MRILLRTFLVSILYSIINGQCIDNGDCTAGLCTNATHCDTLGGTQSVGCSGSEDCLCCRDIPDMCFDAMCTPSDGVCRLGETSVCAEVFSENYGSNTCGDGCQCCVNQLECGAREPTECDGVCSEESACDASCTWEAGACSADDDNCGCCSCPLECPENSVCLEQMVSVGQEIGGCMGDALDLSCEDFCTSKGQVVFGVSDTCGASCTCCICTPSDDGENDCGNGLLEAGEECDDDNSNNGDGCSSHCKIEACPQIIFQSGTTSKNCATKPYTTKNAVATHCESTDSESILIDCDQKLASVYNGPNCEGDARSSIDLENGQCYIGAGIALLDGNLMAYPAASCYGECVISSNSMQSYDDEILQQQGGVIVDHDIHKTSASGVVLWVLFLIAIFIMAIGVTAFLRSRSTARYEVLEDTAKDTPERRVNQQVNMVALRRQEKYADAQNLMKQLSGMRD